MQRALRIVLGSVPCITAAYAQVGAPSEGVNAAPAPLPPVATAPANAPATAPASAAPVNAPASAPAAATGPVVTAVPTPPPARAGVDASAVGPSESSRASAMTVRFLPALSVVYSQIGGSEFDGRHAHAFDADSVAFLPKLSGGFGVRPSLGLLLKNVLPRLGVAVSADLEYSKHQAISYNVGNSWYAHEDAKFFDLALQLRAILYLGRFGPYIGVSPGYAWLKLPNGITTTDSNNFVSWSDLSLHGASYEASAGLLYEVLSFLAADARFGVRLHDFGASSRGSLNGYGFSTGWLASVGAVGML